MTSTFTASDLMTTEDEPGLTAEKIDRSARRGLLESRPEHLTPGVFPRMWAMSAGTVSNAVLRAERPFPLEYVTIPFSATKFVELTSAVGIWNLLWETAQFRVHLYDDEELAAELRSVVGFEETNVAFVPRTRSRYYEYSPLAHLIPGGTLDRFGLPRLCGGHWPFVVGALDVDSHLPADFETRLARAWASTVWRHLNSGSPLSGFSKDDPIRLLAHNLDFWIPPVTTVVQEILREFPLVDNGIDPTQPGCEGLTAARPRVSGDLWCGEAEAAEVVEQTVEAADSGGRLRGILEAVRANRVEDDFSDRWSNARIDFERKLHRTRSKVKVRFVELTDTIPVQGPDTEIEGRLVSADFLALLDPPNRQIVVLLTSGYTKLTEVADVLGYRNHSAVSKRLKQIRDQAARFFGDL